MGQKPDTGWEEGTVYDVLPAVPSRGQASLFRLRAPDAEA